jgi:hypothetical protein
VTDDKRSTIKVDRYRRFTGRPRRSTLKVDRSQGRPLPAFMETS